MTHLPLTKLPSSKLAIPSQVSASETGILEFEVASLLLACLRTGWELAQLLNFAGRDLLESQRKCISSVVYANAPSYFPILLVKGMDASTLVSLRRW